MPDGLQNPASEVATPSNAASRTQTKPATPVREKRDPFANLVTKDELFKRLRDPRLDTRDKKKAFVTGLVGRGYEIEGINATFDPLSSIQNFGKGLVEFAGTLGGAGKTLLETQMSGETGERAKQKARETIGNIIHSAMALPGITAERIEKGVLGIEKPEPTARAIGNKLIEFTGGDPRQATMIANAIADDFSKAFLTSPRVTAEYIERDPFNFLLNTSLALRGGAGSLKAAGMAKTAKVVEAAAKLSDPVAGTIRAIKISPRVAKPIVKALGWSEGLERTAGKLHLIAVEGLTKAPRQAKIAHIKPAEFTKFVAGFNLRGTPSQVAEQAKKIAKASEAELNRLLAASTKLFRLNAVTSSLDLLGQEVGKILKLAWEPGFQKIADRITDLIAKHNTQGLSLSELNEVKRFISNKDIIEIFKSTGERKGARITKLLDRYRLDLRQQIESLGAREGIPNVAKLNRTTQIAQQVRELAESAEAVQAPIRRLFQNWGTTFGIGVAGYYFAGGIPGVIAGFFAKQAVTSPRFHNWLANKLFSLSGAEMNEIAKVVNGKPPSGLFRRVMTKLANEANERGMAAQFNLGTKLAEPADKEKTPDLSTVSDEELIRMMRGGR